MRRTRRVRPEAGSCVHQPSAIRHRELGHSDDIKMLEVMLPADFVTEEVASVNDSLQRRRRPDHSGVGAVRRSLLGAAEVPSTYRRRPSLRRGADCEPRSSSTHKFEMIDVFA